MTRIRLGSAPFVLIALLTAACGQDTTMAPDYSGGQSSIAAGGSAVGGYTSSYGNGGHWSAGGAYMPGAGGTGSAIGGMGAVVGGTGSQGAPMGGAGTAVGGLPGWGTGGSGYGLGGAAPVGGGDAAMGGAAASGGLAMGGAPLSGGGAATAAGGNPSDDGSASGGSSLGGSGNPSGSGNTGTVEYSIDDGGYFSVCGWHGYAWASAGPSSTTMTPEGFTDHEAGDPLCISGSVAFTSSWGGYAMVGFNVNQVAGQEDAPNVAVAPDGTGLYVSVDNTGGSPLRIQIQDELGTNDDEHRWCTEYEGPGVIPWSDFRTLCWGDEGSAYDGEPINAVVVMVPGNDTEDIPYDFCIDRLEPEGAPSCEEPSSGTGGAGGGMGGTTGGTGGSSSSGGGTGTTGGATGTGGSAGATGGATSSGGSGTSSDDEEGYVVNEPWHGYYWTGTEEPSEGSTMTTTGLADAGSGTPVCVEGSVVASSDYTALAMLGVNLNQEMGEDMPLANWEPTGDGILINVSNPGTSTVRVQIQTANGEFDEEERWCYTLSDFDTDVEIPWSYFNTTCWDNEGTFYGDQAGGAGLLPLIQIMIVVSSDDAAATPYDFCLNGISVLDEASGGGQGTIVGDLNGATMGGDGTLSGTDAEYVTRNGVQYVVQNNAWSGGNYTTTYNGTSFTVNNGSGTGNTSGEPLGYPSVFRGSNNNRTTLGWTPTLVSQLQSVPTGWDWTSNGRESSEIWNASYDVWFSRGTGSIASPDAGFLMVWFFKPNGAQPISSTGSLNGGSVTISNHTFDIWTGDNGGVPIISYVARGTLNSWEFDLVWFIEDAQGRSCSGQACMSQNWYLHDVFAGFEIWSGGNGLRTNDFYAAINP